VLVAALFMNWFSLRRARFSWSATTRLFSNSETLAKQVQRHEDLACAAVSQVVRSMLHRLRFDFRMSLNRFIGWSAGCCPDLTNKNLHPGLMYDDMSGQKDNHTA